MFSVRKVFSFRKVFSSVTRMNTARTVEFGNALCGMSVAPTRKPDLSSPPTVLMLSTSRATTSILMGGRCIFESKQQVWDKERSTGVIEEVPGLRCCRRPSRWRGWAKGNGNCGNRDLSRGKLKEA